MYESKAIVTAIKATSRAAIKVGDNFYTVEMTEERSIPDIDGVDIELERQNLFDTVNSVIDSQCEDIINTFKSKRR